ncbi:Spaf_1101 family AAA-like ATPase [Gordoniibacillus kamchatkensis]|nr:AAA family ATPase [Paenibacillus sp. VKM B-2647]
MESKSTLEIVYDLIEKSRKRYGKLKKCEIHFHTPASHDYRLISDKSYSDLCIEEILDIGVTENYITFEVAKVIKDNIEEYTSDVYKIKMMEEGRPYESFKEFFSYGLIAHKLYSSTVEVAVITDHNTVKGYPKLNYALDRYYKERLKNTKQKQIYLFLGVEISCSEKNHLIGIFDKTKYSEVEAFLEEYIINEEEGTYNTAHFMMEQIAKELDGISYIAHINSSDLLGSHGYNSTLFANDEMKVVGITSLDAKHTVTQRISSFNKDFSSKMGYIYESDSHEIHTLGQKNTWIKFSNITFPALKNSINNHNISIYTEKPNKADKFIKGLVIEPGQNGFLKNLDKSRFFVVEFSKDLNCIIGGRGTGKSTILNTIETIFTLHCEDKKKLNFISRSRRIYIVFTFKQHDYIIEFIPQVIDGANFNSRNIYLEKAFKGDNESELSFHWIKIFRILGPRSFHELKEKETIEILHKIYRRGYSINDLVSRIDSGRISSFIKDTILYGVNYEVIPEFIRNLREKPKRSRLHFLRSNLTKMIGEVDARKKTVEAKIRAFNNKYRNTIQVVYSPKEKETEYYLGPLLGPISGNDKVVNTYLSWNDVERYIYKICEKISFLEFLDYLLRKKYRELQELLSIESFIDETKITQRDVEKRLSYIDDTNRHIVFEQIAEVLTYFFDRLMKCLERYFEVTDEFTLEFNVNSRELVDTPKILMKPITELSLGQKVVAMLTFVFQFGHHVYDNTPLIIDQPEDNLDNQYIYKNLVASLRQIKNTRQVIIVTHSSTIVTNADAEQIIVMSSNNEYGWLEKTGYPSDPVILKHVLNNLEGGPDSFKHKVQTYSNLYLNTIR